MRTLLHPGATTLAALCLAAAVPSPAAAQSAGENGAPCLARAVPADVGIDTPASRLSIVLSAPIGSDITFVPGEGSNLALAKPQDLPRPTQEAGGPSPKPIEVAAEGNRLTLWVSTVGVKEGAHEFTLKGSDRSCTARVTVGPKG